VHQDGSCNGIQHYAALGRDPEGAAAVNLARGPAGEGPADVYSRVLDVVLARIAADAGAPVEAATLAAARAENSSVFAQRRAERLYEDIELEAATAPLRKLAAGFLLGRVDRKVVKQTVMTSVYGVTFLGAKDQVWNRLRERFPPSAAGPGGAVDSREDLEFMLRLSSAYLARVTLNSLGTLFSRADAIKTWLADVARAVAARDQPIAWVTPLGLPCVQPYRENEKRTVVTVLQNVVVRETGDPSLPVCRFRQRSAFPPNFIHSLDSTHMFKTALRCRAEGVTFAAVHDSFWTHPAAVGRMRDILRREFVELYEEPVLEQFRESLADRFPGLDLPPLPPKGTFNLREVLDAEYFFS
jgi:DNA-directed RNA polymerase